jgi:hypothetical protein
VNSETAAAIIGASAGIIGAVVGGASAILAARATASKAAQATHNQWHRQSRRDAYAKLILLYQDVLEDLFRFRRDAYEGLLTPEHSSEVHARLIERMPEIRAARIAVEIEGPYGIDHYTGPVLRNILNAIESMHPDALEESDGAWSLPPTFEGGFAGAGLTLSDLTWWAREILSAPDSEIEELLERRAHTATDRERRSEAS